MIVGQVVLSRRNLLTLLSKLDRVKEAGINVSACSLVKWTESGQIMVTAQEDSEVYKDRNAGEVHPLDEPK